MTNTHTHSPPGHLHALLWIDHHEARIYRFDTEVAQATRHVIRNEHSPRHLHHKANTVGSGHAPVSREYMEAVALNIADAQAILILGPSSAKHEFYDYLGQHHRPLLQQIVGVETADHPTDGALLAHAAQSFRAAARLGRPYSPEQS
jgi:stalled ribosome rescue protein Dom34